jgi:N-acetylmuramoyl-L-alanine amidase CwlA
MNITYRLLPNGSKRRPGIKMGKVEFITAHDSGNPGSTAAQNVSYYINSANEMEASAHYFIDDKDIICCIPENEKAWGVRYICPKDNELYGDDANDCSIHIELCYGGDIDNEKAYNNYIELMANICNRYNLKPMIHISGHYLLDPSRRTDPLGALKTVGKTMDDFLKDVDKKVSIIKVLLEMIKRKIKGREYA